MPHVKVLNFFVRGDDQAVRCQVTCGSRVVNDVLVAFQWNDDAMEFAKAMEAFPAGVTIECVASKEAIQAWMRKQKGYGAIKLALDPTVSNGHATASEIYRIDDVIWGNV